MNAWLSPVAEQHWTLTWTRQILLSFDHSHNPPRGKQAREEPRTREDAHAGEREKTRETVEESREAEAEARDLE